MKSLICLISFAILSSLAQAAEWVAISCNATNKCPQSTPCCNQYGTCGTGSYCLGGCDPRSSFNLSACMPQPRMSSFQDSMSNATKIPKIETYLGNSSEADWVYTGYIDNADDALLMQMPKNSTGTVVSSTKYLWFGRVGATIKTSRDVGVVTAFITFSDVQDELDYEFMGYDLDNPQTNFYSLGQLNYTNSKNVSTSNTFENWHYYEIDWSEDKTDWLIDGAVVRTLVRADTWNATSKRYNYPATPSRVQFSLWPAGSDLNAIGTVQWAGGAINWDSQDIQQYGYYYAYIKNVSVTTYDLPSFLKNVTDGSAYLYNSSTSVNEQNVYLTNKKTWLGNLEAVGFNPQNDAVSSLSSSSQKSSSTSGSSAKSTTKGGSTVTGTTGTQTGTSLYTNGFQQNMSSSSKASGSSQSDSKTAGAGHLGSFTGMLAMIGSFLVF